jgi:hypothetical protein
VKTDRSIRNNKPYIIIRYNEKRNMSVNRNYICRIEKCEQDRNRNILKQKDLTIGIEWMWNVKTKVIE